MITLTAELYPCPSHLKALKCTYPSLQGDMSACNGNEEDLTHLEGICMGCGNYVANAQGKGGGDVGKSIQITDKPIRNR